MKRQSQLLHHYENIWGVRGEICAFSSGPIWQLPEDFNVFKFPPHDGRPLWTYATCGMSQPADNSCLELHMFSPIETDEITELLYAVTHFHRTSFNLKLGHSVNFGRPWIVGSRCNFGLISLPYLDGPQLENFLLAGHYVKFLWLIPISSSEVEFKKERGLEELEARFDESGLDYADPARAPVV